jgi:hypothetical protein
MSSKELDDLLDRMPQIAEAVGRFTSESIQSEVFRALIRAFGVAGDTAEDGAPSGTQESTTQGTNNGSGTTLPAPAKKAAPKTAPGAKVKQSFSIDKTLDLVKGGSPSFKEFWESKRPTSVLEKCLVSVYWLTRQTSRPLPATVEQVYTCFKAAGWTVPNDLVNTLQQTGTKGWLDTKKRDDLKVVVQGENHIEHEMPAKPKAT